MAEIALFAPSTSRAGHTLKETASICQICQNHVVLCFQRLGERLHTLDRT